jgi:hypothetical protein
MYDEVREQELAKLADKGMENKGEAQIEATNLKGKKKSDIIDFIAKCPPPHDKKERIEYTRNLAKEIGCTQNFIYKIMKGTL